MTEVALTIRDAELGDATALAALMCELGYKTVPAEMETRLRRIVGNPSYKTFVAEYDERVCGTIGTFSYASYEHNDFSGRIVALVVSEKARRHGVGRALIAAAEREFARQGIVRVALDTRLTREEAHKFYESLGYVRNGWRFVKELKRKAGAG